LIAGAALGLPFSEPVDITAQIHIGPDTRVDEWAIASLRFPGDILANLTCGIMMSTDNHLHIWGSDGHIVCLNPWFPGPDNCIIQVYRDNQPEPEHITVASELPLYSIEADTVARNLAARQAPAPCMNWADSLGNMETLDRWRKGVGLVFDNEKPKALSTPTAGRPVQRLEDAPMLFGRVAGIDKPVSRVVMGSMAFNPSNLPYICAMLDNYYEQGGNCIDTAYVYQSEVPVGQWLKLRQLREQIVLIVKGAHTPNCNPEDLVHQLDDSLGHLQTGYCDLYMMHRDNQEIPAGDFIECLNEQLRLGKIRAFGGSNWSTARIQEANAYAQAHGLVGFAASSPNLALAQWNEPMWAGCVAASDKASRGWYQAAQMPVFAWSSQASGFFTGRFSPENRSDPHIKDVVRCWFNDANFQRLERARQMADEKGVEATQIALAYVLCQPFPTFALIGPRSIEETRSSLAALQVYLTPSELQWLNLGD